MTWKMYLIMGVMGEGELPAHDGLDAIFFLAGQARTIHHFNKNLV